MLNYRNKPHDPKSSSNSDTMNLQFCIITYMHARTNIVENP